MISNQELFIRTEPTVQEVVDCIAERRYADIAKIAKCELSLTDLENAIELFLHINKLPYIDKYGVECNFDPDDYIYHQFKTDVYSSYGYVKYDLTTNHELNGLTLKMECSITFNTVTLVGMPGLLERIDDFMSTRRTALCIFNQLDEEQLQGFMTMFGEVCPENQSTRETALDIFDQLDEEQLQGFMKMVGKYPKDQYHYGHHASFEHMINSVLDSEYFEQYRYLKESRDEFDNRWI